MAIFSEEDRERLTECTLPYAGGKYAGAFARCLLALDAKEKP